MGTVYAQLGDIVPCHPTDTLAHCACALYKLIIYILHYIFTYYRRTDGRTIYDRNTALCTKVHHAVKTNGANLQLDCYSHKTHATTLEAVHLEWQ